MKQLMNCWNPQSFRKTPAPLLRSTLLRAAIGKELESIHNSTLRFRFFGIDFWNAPFQLHWWNWGVNSNSNSMDWGDSTCLNFPLAIQVSLVIQKTTSDTWFTSFFNFSTDFKTNIGIPWNPPILFNKRWSCGTDSNIPDSVFMAP